MKFKRSRAHMLVLALFMSVFFAAPLVAQTTTGTLRGQVTDPSGAAVIRANIYVSGAKGQTTSAKTNRDGAYEVKGLLPGSYTVTAAAKGFATFQQQSVEIAAGEVRKLDIPLQIEQQKEQVTVEGEAAKVSVSPENNASALVIKGKDLEALSDDPDELQSELEALAGPSAGPNGGQIYIDGFTGGQLPPKSAIREIRVNQNPFSAEYDRLGYGRIEILTKPGTEKFHGRAFVSGNDSVFNSRNPFAKEIPSYHSEFLDGNLGGPLSKKASFFVDGGRRDIQDASVVSAVTLGSSLTPSPFTQSVFTPRTRTEISPRVDYQVSANNTLTVRYQYWNNDEKNRGVGQFALPSQAYNLNETENTLQASDSQVLSARTVNETRFRYRRSGDTQAPFSAAPSIQVLGAFTGGGSGQGRIADAQNSYELQNYTSMALGKHMLKFGARLRDSDQASSVMSGFNGTFTFPSILAYQQTEQALAQCSATGQSNCQVAGASQFSITGGTPLVRIHYVDFEPYVEDDWRVRPNFSLSLGLRFETQDHIHDHADFAPRVGLAWGIGGGRSPKTVLRAGVGVFYDRFEEDQILQAERLNGVNQQQYILALPDFFPIIPPLSTLNTLANQAPRSVYQIDPNLRAPYVLESAVGLERQLFKNATASLTYLNSHGLHQLLTRNINAPLPGTYDPLDPASGLRPFGDIGNIYQYESAGLFNQNELIANFNIRRSKVSFFGFYTLNYADSNTAGASSFPANQYDLAADYGPSAYDVHHRVFVGGSWNLPRGFQLFPFVVASSGRPFNITLGQDLNGDSIFNDRPVFATTSSGSNIVVTKWGTFSTNPALGGTVVPANYGIGPGLFTMNLRLSKTFGFGPESGGGGGGGGFGGHHGGHGEGLGGRGLGSGGGGWSWGNSTNRKYNLTLGVSARNIFNNVNLAPPVGNLNSPLFGRSNSLMGGFFSSSAANRRIDFQAIFSF